MILFKDMQIKSIIELALSEDISHGDWTTDLCVEASIKSTAEIISKCSTIVAGVDVIKSVFNLVDPEIQLDFDVLDGDKVNSGDRVVSISGLAHSILKGERVAMNFLGRMSGIADMTRKFADKISHTSAELLDTRKTTPGLRVIEKRASRIGGARNHRMCLSDGVLIKENHIRAAGSIAKAFDKLTSLPPTIKIEVETTCLEEVEEALFAGADIIMLDNMSTDDMKKAVLIVAGKALVEVSGNVSLDNIADIATTGVDFISTSAMFHSSKWSDFTLLVC